MEARKSKSKKLKERTEERSGSTSAEYEPPRKRDKVITRMAEATSTKGSRSLTSVESTSSSSSSSQQKQAKSTISAYKAPEKVEECQMKETSAEDVQPIQVKAQKSEINLVEVVENSSRALDGGDSRHRIMEANLVDATAETKPSLTSNMQAQVMQEMEKNITVRGKVASETSYKPLLSSTNAASFDASLEAALMLDPKASTSDDSIVRHLASPPDAAGSGKKKRSNAESGGRPSPKASPGPRLSRSNLEIGPDSPGYLAKIPEEGEDFTGSLIIKSTEEQVMTGVEVLQEASTDESDSTFDAKNKTKKFVDSAGFRPPILKRRMAENAERVGAVGPRAVYLKKRNANADVKPTTKARKTPDADGGKMATKKNSNTNTNGNANPNSTFGKIKELGNPRDVQRSMVLPPIKKDKPDAKESKGAKEEKPKETTKEKAKELTKQKAKEITKEKAKEITKEDKPMEIPKQDKSKEIPKEEKPKEITKEEKADEKPMEITKEDKPREITKEEKPKEIIKEKPKEIIKEKPRKIIPPSNAANGDDAISQEAGFVDVNLDVDKAYEVKVADKNPGATKKKAVRMVVDDSDGLMKIAENVVKESGVRATKMEVIDVMIHAGGDNGQDVGNGAKLDLQQRDGKPDGKALRQKNKMEAASKKNDDKAAKNDGKMDEQNAGENKKNDGKVVEENNGKMNAQNGEFKEELFRKLVVIGGTVFSEKPKLSKQIDEIVVEDIVDEEENLGNTNARGDTDSMDGALLTPEGKLEGAAKEEEKPAEKKARFSIRPVWRFLRRGANKVWPHAEAGEIPGHNEKLQVVIVPGPTEIVRRGGIKQREEYKFDAEGIKNVNIVTNREKFAAASVSPLPNESEMKKKAKPGNASANKDSDGLGNLADDGPPRRPSLMHFLAGIANVFRQCINSMRPGYRDHNEVRIIRERPSLMQRWRNRRRRTAPAKGEVATNG